MTRMAYFCWVSVVLVLLWGGCGCNALISSTLYEDLLGNYKTSLLPICSNGPRFVNVSLNIALRQILLLNEKEQIMTSNVWVRMGWTDCQLTWNSSQYGFIDNLRVPYSDVWVPDLALYDSSAEEIMLPGLTEYRVQLYSDGTVKYNFPTVLHSVCRVQVTYFPFDTQECGLKFGSWSHTQLDMDFYPSSQTGDLSSFITNNEWIVKRITAQRNVIMYSEPYADVNFIVIMSRRPDHYVMTMLFPCILIGATAAIGFLLPAESGEKVSLEVTVLLSQSVFLLVISDFLPPSADNFPILGLYFAVSMLLVGLSLVMAVFVLNVHHRGDVKGKTVPSWARRYLLQNPRKLCFSNKYDVDRVDSTAKVNKGFVKDETSMTPTTSIILCGKTYQLPNSRPNQKSESTSNCEWPRKPKTSIQNKQTNSKNTIGHFEMSSPTEKLKNDSGQKNYPTENQQRPEVSLPKEHRRMLRNIERHFILSDDEENVREDWQKLARILDRFCLLLYIICFSVVTVIYVLQLVSRNNGS